MIALICCFPIIEHFINILIISCDSVESADKAVENIRPLTKFLRTKNKTVSKDNVELILEFKSKDEKAMEKMLSSLDMEFFSFLFF